MKTKYVLLSLISFLLVFSTLVLAGEADRSAVAVSVDPYNRSVSVGIDILGIKGYTPAAWAHNVWAPFRLITYPADYCVYMGKEHPFQSIGIVLTGIELKTGKVSDAAEDVWDGITGLFGGDDDDDDEPEPTPSPTPQPGSEQTGSNNSTVNGSGNTITQNTTYNWNMTPTPTPTPAPLMTSPVASMGGW